MPSNIGPEIHNHEIHHHSIPDFKPIEYPASSKTSLKSLISKLFSASASSAASLAGKASSAVAQGAVSIATHVGKASVAGAAASSASLLSAKKQKQNYNYGYHSDHEHYTNHHDYEYEDEHNTYYDESKLIKQYVPTKNSEAASDNLNIHSVIQPETDKINYKAPAQDHVASSKIPTISNNNYDSIPSSFAPSTDSYVNPISDTSELFKDSVPENTPFSFDSINIAQDAYKQYLENANTATQFNFNAPELQKSSVQLSLTPGSVNNFNSKPQLYFGLNMPLDASDFTNTNTNNFNTYPTILGNGYANQYAFDFTKPTVPTEYTFENTNPTIYTKPVDLDANSADLRKLLGPSGLLEPRHVNKQISFLPTPLSNLENPAIFKTNNIYSASHQNVKSPSHTRIPSRQRNPFGYDFTKSVGYELGPNGSFKLD